MSSSLPLELLDLIVDHLCDEPIALKGSSIRQLVSEKNDGSATIPGALSAE